MKIASLNMIGWQLTLSVMPLGYEIMTKGCSQIEASHLRAEISILLTDLMCPFCIVMWFISCLFYSTFHTGILEPPWKGLAQLWYGKKETNLHQDISVGKTASNLPARTGEAKP